MMRSASAAEDVVASGLSNGTTYELVDFAWWNPAKWLRWRLNPAHVVLHIRQGGFVARQRAIRVVAIVADT